MDPQASSHPVAVEVVIAGARTRLRPIAEDDVAPLVRIRSTPEVRARWRGADIDAEVRDGLTDAELHVLVIETLVGEVIGAIQWAASDDEDYPHASVDVYLDPAVHQQGLGADAVGALCRFLLTDGGFHRLVIDPAVDNTAAIRCYSKVGFRPVGIMRAYERGIDGSLHDGLLMDLLADDLAGP
jgi:aminoglycoside 6'-N-acetyltransferase